MPLLKAIVVISSVYIGMTPLFILASMSAIPIHLINHSVEVEEVGNNVVLIFDDIDGEVSAVNYYINKETFEKEKVVFVYEDNQIRINPEKYNQTEIEIIFEIEKILDKTGTYINRAVNNRFSPHNWTRRWW